MLGFTLTVSLPHSCRDFSFKAPKSTLHLHVPLTTRLEWPSAAWRSLISYSHAWWLCSELENQNLKLGWEQRRSGNERGGWKEKGRSQKKKRGGQKTGRGWRGDRNRIDGAEDKWNGRRDKWLFSVWFGFKTVKAYLITACLASKVGTTKIPAEIRGDNKGGDTVHTQTSQRLFTLLNGFVGHL